MGQRPAKPVKKQNKKVAKKPSPKRIIKHQKKHVNKKGGLGSANIAQAASWSPGQSTPMVIYQQPLYHSFPIYPMQPVQPMQAITNSSQGSITHITESQPQISSQDVTKIASELKKIDTKNLDKLTNDLIVLLNPSKSKSKDINKDYIDSVRNYFVMINKVLRNYKQDSTIRVLLTQFLEKIRPFNSEFENLLKELQTTCIPEELKDPKYKFSLLKWPILERHLVYKLQSFANLIVKKIDVVVTTAKDILEIKSKQYPFINDIYEIEVQIDKLLSNSNPDSSEKIEKLRDKKRQIIAEFNKGRKGTQEHVFQNAKYYNWGIITSNLFIHTFL